ncbi:MAG: PEP-CTERM sorting domain-containing protein [Planctomycetota bacterium]|nr:PEP-CTERM sorting domain-containing protein [Planctomycetota bacterium]
MNTVLKHITFALPLVTLGLLSVSAQAGYAIAVDFANDGGSATNFNVIDSNATIAAGNVIRHSDGSAVDGVSLTFAGATGFNDDTAANGWTGQEADPYYVEAVNGLTYASGTAGPITLTFAGLDDSLLYNVRVYSLFSTKGTRTETFSVTDGSGTVGSTIARSVRWNASTLELGGTVYNGVFTDGSGNIVVSVTGANVDNPFLNAVVLEAVPEPSTLTLCIMGLCGLAASWTWRKRSWPIIGK